MVQWPIICLPKEQGGLGVLDLDIMNKALLDKWLWNLENSDGLWQEVLRNKYLKNRTLRQVTHKNGESQFWLGVADIKDSSLNCCCGKVENGENTLFWEDCWWGRGKTTTEFAPYLYNIINE